MHRIIFQGNNRSAYAAAGGHLVSRFQLTKHGLPFFLPPLLRHDQNKIEDGEYKDEGRDPDPTRGAARLPGN